jgi:hypothetical protein
MIKVKFIQIFFIFTFLTSIGSSASFEQNGVNEGNVKLSAALYSTQSSDEFDTFGLTTQLGYFFTDRIEVLIGLDIDVERDEIYYTLAPGISYYFYKTLITSSYIGAKLYYWNTSNEYIEEKKGNTFYLGTDLFISENVAITPEIGINYLDFKTKKGTYFNTYLTYFFN